MMLQMFEEGLQKLFILVLNMSLTACVVILAVILVRLLLRRAPRIFSYGLWAAVLFRLLCPVSFSLPFSLLGALRNEPAVKGRMEYIAEDIGYWEKPEVALPVPGVSEAVNEHLPLEDREASVNPMQIYVAVGAYVWLLGVMSAGVYGAVSLRRFQGSLKDAVHEKENIYRFGKKGSPFVYGLFHPGIYLPENMTAEEERYILLHERIHIKRGDAVFRLFFCLALGLHWFNPLVWAAFVLSGRDMEMSCDEAVIRRLGSKVKKEYSTSLLNMAADGRAVKGIPLAFGESDTGGRVKNVLRYKKPATPVIAGTALLSILFVVAFLANPARTKENTNIFYGVATETAGREGVRETMVRIPGIGDVALPGAGETSLYLERDAGEIIMPGDILRISFSPKQEITVAAAEQNGQTLYHFVAEPAGEAESIQVMGEGFLLTRQEEDRYLFTVPLGMASEAQAGDILEIYHDPNADTTAEIYLSVQDTEPGQELLAAPQVLSVDEENYDIWVELSAQETEVFLSEFGFGISVELRRTSGQAGSGEPAEEAEASQGENDVPSAENGIAAYADPLSEDAGSGPLTLSPEQLDRKELPDGIYMVYVESLSYSARGVDRYVTEEEYDEEPLFPFADTCEFRVNWETDKLDYSPVSFDKFADLVTQSTEVINPTVYCRVKDNQIVRADLESGYYREGFTYERPVRNSFEPYAETAGEDQQLTEEELLRKYYTLAKTETADIGDGAGIEQIEVYTGNIGDGASGVVFFKGADGKVLGTEFAHSARAGWNNVYIGDAEGVNYILTVHIEDRDTYGSYGYQVYRLTEDGQMRQIAGSRFDFGGNYHYDDEMFRTWADNLTYYLRNSHLALSSQEGEIRTETVSEADKYSYENLKRGL